VDVIHFQKCHFYTALPAILAAYFNGKTVHYDWDDWEEKIFYSSVHKKTLSTILTGISFQLMERGLPFLADSVSVSSQALRELAIKRGADKNRIVMAPVGADLDLFTAGRYSRGIREKHGINGELLVLYHGQLHSCQYVNLFLQAIKIISGTTMASRLKFMVLGDGSQRATLQKSSQSLGVGGRVIFTGFVPHADIPQYVAAADICVAPFEDNEVTRCKSPLKIAEYLASGKAIIASDVGEAGNMVQGVGLLVPPGDSEGLARGILELAGNDALRKTMELAARRRAEEKYNWRFSAENLEKAYLLNGI
jgi:glycosyltransferase involved in cell wall biosynthesis